MKKLIVANWKGNPSSFAQVEEILSRVDECLSSEAFAKEGVSLVVCPPFMYLEEVARILGTGHLEYMAELGVQDLTTESRLIKLGVRYVIIGHSSRRAAGESDAVVNKKLKQALQDGFVPVVCVEDATQARGTFAGLSPDELQRCLVAYEPVWAISTSPCARPDTPMSALESVGVIRDALSLKSNVESLRFLYGGSITEKNAKDFLSRPEFSGVLVGGASVRADEFCRILSIAAQLT